jgi:outer membrane receptor protein involved in Fe transport
MKRITLLTAGWLLLILTFGLPSGALAQGVQSGTVRGVVNDQQGLPVPGVVVTAASPALQGLRSNVTETDGTYVFRTLPPGDYTFRFELSNFQTVERAVALPLGLAIEQNVTMIASGVAEAVNVVAETPAPIATPIIGANYTHDEIEQLATSRTLSGIAELSPGLTDVTPNTDQVSINGAFAFDNVFMINGVDVNDNLFGSPQNLFIEDAIQETQVLTSGISAEYGRFSGGVVNAITRSGGNAFSGSGRLNLANPGWSTETPFEVSNGVEHKNSLNQSWEGTFGGPLVRDRLWFFAAGRYENLERPNALNVTGFAYTQQDLDKRAELKLTGSLDPNHTIAGGFVNSPVEQTNRPSFSFAIDPRTLDNRRLPNSYYYTTYNGILSSKLLVEARYSQRKLSFEDSGGSSAAIVDSPFITLTQALGLYNAPYFDASDGEHRNNRQFTGNLTYFTEGSGRHEIKSGYEWYRSQDTGGNSQSATGYVFDADYLTGTDGNPVYDANGDLMPVFEPNSAYLENWLPLKGAVLNVDTQSVFAQDHWTFNPNLSFDLGVRYEHVRSEATGGLIGINTDTVVPRLALAYDLRGDGRYVAHVTYGHYSGRYNEAQIGANNNVSNPDLLVGIYKGPSGTGRDFAPGFDPANYVTFFGRFPTANVTMSDGMSSPVTKEFTTSLGAQVTDRGWVEGTYVFRRTGNIIEDIISIDNGVTTVVRDGFDVGTFTNSVYVNSDVATRRYQGLLFQARYNVKANWSLNGHYTLMLQNDGNYEGEATNQPGLVSVIGDYPEIRTEAQHYPMGRLQDFQRHKLRLWSIYSFTMGRWGDASVSGLWRVNSGQVYSLRADGLDITDEQLAILDAADYPDAPTSQSIFYGARGSEFFKGYGLFDASFNYNVPVFRTLRPWVKVDVYNLFNNLKQIGWDTTIEPDPNSPVDNLGLHTGYVKGENFGEVIGNEDFPTPIGTVVGGRTLRVAVGFRF